jgi:hypothetical protein
VGADGWRNIATTLIDPSCECSRGLHLFGQTTPIRMLGMTHRKRVEYRGESMIEGWPEKIEAAQRVSSYALKGRSIARIPYGSERKDWGADKNPCHGCRVLKSGFHVPSCDVEECPICGTQLLTCDCELDLVLNNMQKPRLINSRFTAAIAVILTGYIAALTIRAAFWQLPHRFHWFIQLDYLLPQWAVLTANLTFYALLLSTCIGLLWSLRGKERFVVAGWVLAVLLGPIQGMISRSLDDAIQYVKAGSIMVALFAAVVILIEGPVNDEAAAEPLSE